MFDNAANLFLGTDTAETTALTPDFLCSFFKHHSQHPPIKTEVDGTPAPCFEQVMGQLLHIRCCTGAAVPMKIFRNSEIM